MRRALRLAERGWGQTAPNPMVGAVVTRDDVRIAEGFHPRFGSEHAEVAALRAAGEGARGSTLYVSLQPCNHAGKTPACTSAIIDAGVRRVVLAVRDPNPTAAGGIERLRDAGIQVDEGVEEEPALELNAPFFNHFRGDRPWVTLKLALSLDGALADGARSKGWLTSTSARKEVHRMRANSDAVAVGLGTVIADDPALTVRSGVKVRVPPVRLVFARRGLLPDHSVLARTAHEIPTWLVVVAPVAPQLERLSSLGVRVIPAHDLPEAMRILAGEGIRSVMVEGGASITGALLDNGLVDRLAIFRAPIVLGRGALNAFSHVRAELLPAVRRLRLVRTRMAGDDQLSTYAITSL